MAVENLRTPNGRSTTYPWKYPIKLKDIAAGLNKVSQVIYGTDENTINKLNSINMHTLLVEQISCSGGSTVFQFETMNPVEPFYWSERWELYKFSYAMAIWAWTKKITMIEFYNEPDIQLGFAWTQRVIERII